MTSHKKDPVSFSVEAVLTKDVTAVLGEVILLSRRYNYLQLVIANELSLQLIREQMDLRRPVSEPEIAVCTLYHASVLPQLWVTARIAGALVGFACASGYLTGTCYVKFLFVIPELETTKIAGALLKFIETGAAELGCTAIQSDVLLDSASLAVFLSSDYLVASSVFKNPAVKLVVDEERRIKEICVKHLAPDVYSQKYVGRARLHLKHNTRDLDKFRTEFAELVQFEESTGYLIWLSKKLVK